jgi:hypothetical protein
MTKTARGVVYWLFDDSCTDVQQHGYVGMTVSWPRRLWRHRSESTFPVTEFQGRVLFEGTVKQCLDVELKLRPTAGIGWNKFPGGRSGHAMKGIPKSPEQRAKMRAAALERYKDPKEHERTSRDVKRGRRRAKVDQSGANNPMYGRPMSEATKEKIRQKIIERGGVSGANNPNFGGRRR